MAKYPWAIMPQTIALARVAIMLPAQRRELVARWPAIKRGMAMIERTTESAGLALVRMPAAHRTPKRIAAVADMAELVRDFRAAERTIDAAVADETRSPLSIGSPPLMAGLGLAIIPLALVLVFGAIVVWVLSGQREAGMNERQAIITKGHYDESVALGRMQQEANQPITGAPGAPNAPGYGQQVGSALSGAGVLLLGLGALWFLSRRGRAA